MSKTVRIEMIRRTATRSGLANGILYSVEPDSYGITADAQRDPEERRFEGLGRVLRSWSCLSLAGSGGFLRFVPLGCEVAETRFRRIGGNKGLFSVT
jgi:hypothetical protein